MPPQTSKPDLPAGCTLHRTQEALQALLLCVLSPQTQFTTNSIYRRSVPIQRVGDPSVRWDSKYFLCGSAALR